MLFSLRHQKQKTQFFFHLQFLAPKKWNHRNGKIHILDKNSDFVQILSQCVTHCLTSTRRRSINMNCLNFPNCLESKAIMKQRLILLQMFLLLDKPNIFRTSVSSSKEEDFCASYWKSKRLNCVIPGIFAIAFLHHVKHFLLHLSSSAISLPSTK